MEINTTLNQDQLLYVNTNSLSKDLCKDLIQFFENDRDRYGYDGLTAGGMNKDVKDTTDLVLSQLTHIRPWNKVHKLLTNELQYNIAEYMKNVSDNLGENNDGYSILQSPKLLIPSMQMQKYNKNVGKYVYHNDYQCDFNKKKMRQITFLWYINDVEEGGETQFWENIKVKPTAGKLVLFPAHWTYPHKANVPISDDKYIITGWVYEHY